MQSLENSQEVRQIESTLLSPLIPKLYANGFVCGQTLSDAFIVLQLNGLPISVLNLSLSSAKSLMSDLEKMVADYEHRTETEILTMAEVKDKLEK
jgi:hypothetical protein